MNSKIEFYQLLFQDEDERKDRKRVSESSRGVDKKDDLRRDMKKDRKRVSEALFNHPFSLNSRNVLNRMSFL